MPIRSNRTAGLYVVYGVMLGYQTDDQMVFGLVKLLACLLRVTKLLDLNRGGRVTGELELVKLFW